MKLFRRYALISHQGTSWSEVRIHLGVTILVCGSLTLNVPRFTLLFGGVLVFVTYIHIGLREARKSPVLLTPLSFFFFWYSIGLGLSPIYLALILGEHDMVKFASPWTLVSMEDMATGYALFVLGSCALHIGLQTFRPKSQVSAFGTRQRGLLGWIVVVWLCGLIFQLSPATFKFLGGATRILAVALVGSVCALATTPREEFKLSRPVFLLLIGIGTAGLFFGNLASGSKAYIMFSFLPIVWFVLMARRRRVWLIPVALVLVTFYFTVVAPVVSTSRLSPMDDDKDPRVHLLETFEAWSRDRPGSLDSEFFAEQADQFLNRQFDPVPVAFIVGEVKHSGLLMGETMQYASYALVPRVLWPDKPSVTRGAWFSTYLGLFQTESEATTSVGMTATGELYWNFGTIGVIAGMLLIGSCIGALWRMAGSDPRHGPLHMLLYVSLILSMSDMPEAVTVFVSLAITFLTFKFCFTLFELISKQARRRSYSSLVDSPAKPSQNSLF